MIDMIARLYKALKLGGDLYNLDDIKEAVQTGKMQGHVIGDTWVITKVQDWPRKRTVEISYVVGKLDDSLEIEEKIVEWAKSLGASKLTAIGRDGWWKFRTPGWKKVGTLYAKDI